MSAAVLTRWWYVNTAALHLKEHFGKWMSFAQKLLNSTTADTKMGKIASSVLSLGAEPKIYCDLLFICAYSKAFFVEHFEWLQGYDSVAKDFGYRSRDMAMWSYLIITELEFLAKNWESHPAFAEYVEAWKQLKQVQSTSNTTETTLATSTTTKTTTATATETTTKAIANSRTVLFTDDHMREDANLFFKIGIESVKKHFDIWRRENLAYALVSSEPEISRTVAKWPMEGSEPECGVTYNASKCHGESSVCKEGREQVDLQKVLNYFKELTTREELQQDALVLNNTEAIKKASTCELGVWDEEDKELEALQAYAKTWVLPHASSTHRTEACIREASHCSSTGRSEEQRSALVVQRSVANSAITRTVQEEATMRTLHGNQHMSTGMMGSRTHTSKVSQKKHSAQTESADPSAIKGTKAVHSPGYYRLKVLLCNTKTQFDAVGGSKYAIARKKVACFFKSNDMKASTSRSKVKVKVFDVTSKVARAPNKIERERGVDVPAHCAGLVKFGDLRKTALVPWVRGELTERGVEHAHLTGIKTLRLLLKEALGGTNNAFKPLTGVPP